MSAEKVREYFVQAGREDVLIALSQSSATVELAAQALNCEPREIAKTLSFDCDGRIILIVAAGDAKIDNPKYRAFFSAKARMLPGDQVESLVGHGIGGVCPFAVNPGVCVYLDISLKRFEHVFAAAGSIVDVAKLTIPELEQFSGYLEWIDVCKGWQEE